MKTATPKMFKGTPKYYVEQRLLNHGWPQPLAGLTAAYMTGEGPVPVWMPDWKIVHVDTVENAFDLLRNRRIIEP